MLKNIFVPKKIILVISLLCLAVVAWPRDTAAVDTGQLGLIPAHPDLSKPSTTSWFVYEDKQGVVIEDTARIVNHNPNEAITVNLYPVDGTTTTNGVFALTMPTDPQTGIGVWVQIQPPTELPASASPPYEPIATTPSNQNSNGNTNTTIKEEIPVTAPIVDENGKTRAGLQITVPANRSVVVPFKLTIPETAEVGEHTGGLIIEMAPKKREGTGFNIVTRIGARIYLTVPGEKVYGLKLKDFSWHLADYTADELARMFLGKVQRFLGLNRKGTFSVRLENLGNMQLGTAAEPLKGKLTIKNIVNQVIDENEVDLGNILPKKEITQNLSWQRRNPLFLRYQALLEVSYNKDEAPVTAEIFFWVIPWPLILLLAALIVLVVIIWLIIRLVRLRLRMKMTKYVVQRGDTPELIAGHFQVSLTKLVKINKIKADRPIQPGQTLHIPPSDLVPDPAAFRLARINIAVWITNGILFAVLLVLAVILILQLAR